MIAPATDSAAVVVFVELALESLSHIVYIIKTIIYQ